MSALKFPSQWVKIPVFFLFIIIFAALLSLGMECLLILLCISMGIALDSSAPVNQYPRFLPFCIIVGFLVLVSLVLLVFVNIKVSKKINYTKRTWWVQSVLAFFVSIPMIKLWEMLFDSMQKMF